MKKLMQEGEGDGELVDEIMFEYLIGALMKDKMLLDRIQKHNYPGDTRRMHPIESEKDEGYTDFVSPSPNFPHFFIPELLSKESIQ